jgi:hypothetical protein
MIGHNKAEIRLVETDLLKIALIKSLANDPSRKIAHRIQIVIRDKGRQMEARENRIAKKIKGTKNSVILKFKSCASLFLRLLRL